MFSFLSFSRQRFYVLVTFLVILLVGSLQGRNFFRSALAGPQAAPAHNPSALPTPLHHYTFDGNTDDSGIGGATGILMNGATLTTSDPRVGTGALLIQNSDQWMLVNEFGMDTTWSVSLWARRDFDSLAATVFASGGGTQLRGESSTVNNEVGVSNITEEYASGYQLPVGQWAHLTYVSSGSDIRLYVNGVYRYTFSVSNANLPRYTIGGVDGFFGFLGAIDDVRIYDVNLSVVQVDELYSLYHPNFLYGVVYPDQAVDGTRSNMEVNGVGGITVTAYDAAGTAYGPVTTDNNGSFLLDLSAVADGTPLRLEFTDIPDDLSSSVFGPHSGTTVQFFTKQSQMPVAYLGLTTPTCDGPFLATSCYVSGDPESGTGPHDVLVMWPYGASGFTPAPTHLANKAEIGSVWGLAYRPSTNVLYSAAFLKRHIGLKEGAGGSSLLGGIYATSVSAATSTLFFDLGTVAGIDLGHLAGNAARGLGSPITLSNDEEAYYQIGRIGLGDLDMAEDGNTLWVTNLYQKRLHSIAINPDGSPGTVNSYNIPTSQCNTANSIYLNVGNPSTPTNLQPIDAPWGGDGYYVEEGSIATFGAQPAPFNTQRNGQILSYLIPVPNGDYTVTLYFFNNGRRVFNTNIEGTVEVRDIFPNQQVTIPTSVTVNDSLLNITLTPNLHAPILNGIAIAPTQGQVFNDTQPFGLKVYNGKVYVGLVCSAEYTQDRDTMRAWVYELNPGSGTFTPVLDFPLDYAKGSPSTPCSDIYNLWLPWALSFPESCGAPAFPQRVVYPQPMLTDIEFDDDGSMILGFVDRFGHQGGYFNYKLTGTGLVNEREAVTSGEILRAAGNGTSFTLESNGTVGGNSATWGGVNNGEGPGGGEFYQDDVNPPRSHQEISHGGLALLRRSGQVVVTAQDPNGVAVSGGVVHFNNTTGTQEQGYNLYVSDPPPAPSQGKAAGVGDLELICQPGPMELGNRVWLDADQNGIQDPGESTLGGVLVGLYGPTGNWLATTTTGADGTYYFNDSNVPGGIQPLTTYTIGILESNFITGTGVLAGYIPTTPDNGESGGLANGDIRDSDGVNIVAGSGATLTSLGVTFTTGTVGSSDHTYDFGFYLIPTAITLSDFRVGHLDRGQTVFLLVTMMALAATTLYVWLGRSQVKIR